ncbi:hypothetical protein [Leifsonia sp. WHRI 6310E]|uniref:hypothetical protein n=1 Tax=Leifsonia sp. WHRI 6310E TaxID=3162562 RepID=UPI0032EFC655
MTEGLERLWQEIASRGLRGKNPSTHPVYCEWASDMPNRLGASELETFFIEVDMVLSGMEESAEVAHFWIRVFEDTSRNYPSVPWETTWPLMSGISRVAVATNFDELAELTNVPAFLPSMTMIYRDYFARSKSPRVPELLRRLIEPDELIYPGLVGLGATIAANQRYVCLIPTLDHQLLRIRNEQPDDEVNSEIVDALFRLRRVEYAQEMKGEGADILLADLAGKDAQTAAFAAHALGARKAIAALPRLRELAESPDVRLRREAKAAVKKLEKLQAS